MFQTRGCIFEACLQIIQRDNHLKPRDALEWQAEAVYHLESGIYP